MNFRGRNLSWREKSSILLPGKVSSVSSGGNGPIDLEIDPSAPPPPPVHNSSSIALDWLPSVTPGKWPLGRHRGSGSAPTRERVYVSIGQLGRMLLRPIRPFIWLESAEATAGRWLLSRATNLVWEERETQVRQLRFFGVKGSSRWVLRSSFFLDALSTLGT